jgi:hypothetical protein
MKTLLTLCIARQGTGHPSPRLRSTTFYPMRHEYACLKTTTVIHLPHRNKCYSLG